MQRPEPVITGKFIWTERHLEVLLVIIIVSLCLGISAVRSGRDFTVKPFRGINNAEMREIVRPRITT